MVGRDATPTHHCSLNSARRRALFTADGSRPSLLLISTDTTIRAHSEVHEAIAFHAPTRPIDLPPDHDGSIGAEPYSIRSLLSVGPADRRADSCRMAQLAGVAEPVCGSRLRLVLKLGDFYSCADAAVRSRPQPSIDAWRSASVSTFAARALLGMRLRVQLSAHPKSGWKPGGCKRIDLANEPTVT